MINGSASKLLGRRCFAPLHRLPILGRFLGTATVGVEPGLMGIGLAYAILKLLETSCITTDEVYLLEPNEAIGSQIASQVLWCQRELNIPEDEREAQPERRRASVWHPLGTFYLVHSPGR